MTFKPDHLMLMSFLESNFDTKQEWRIEQGIVEGGTNMDVENLEIIVKKKKL